MVAFVMDIPHRFCDPSKSEKERLGIAHSKPAYINGTPECHKEWCEYFGKQWLVREEFWINKLGTYINDRVLFICGANHRWTFRRRLDAKGIAVIIIEKKFGLSSRPTKVEFEAYKCVRRNGFPSGNMCKTCMQPSSGYN
jgi:hypothetical protein